MTNFERYKDEMLKELATTTNSLTCLVAKMRGQKDCGVNIKCDNCYELNAKWLDAEYEEPRTDWSNVKQGTNVYNKYTDIYIGKFVAEYDNHVIISHVDDVISMSAFTKDYYEVREEDK